MLPAHLAGCIGDEASSTGTAPCMCFLVPSRAPVGPGQDRKWEHGSCAIHQLRQRGNWKVKLGAGGLIHPKDTQWLGWIHDVNSEEQICFLLLSRNTNEKINSYHFLLLETGAESRIQCCSTKSGADPGQLVCSLDSFGGFSSWSSALVLLCSRPRALLKLRSCFNRCPQLAGANTCLSSKPSCFGVKPCPQPNLALLRLRRG